MKNIMQRLNEVEQTRPEIAIATLLGNNNQLANRIILLEEIIESMGYYIPKK